MSWRNELTVGIMRAERIFYGTSNGGLGSELSTTELGWLDDLTPGTGQASKCLVLDANADITGGIRNFNVDGDLSSDQDITAGVDGTTYGRIYAYGGLTDQGGFIRMYTAANSDDTDEFASINVTSEEMWLGFENDLDQLVIYGTGHATYPSEIHATTAFVAESTFDVAGAFSISGGSLGVGVSDSTQGVVSIYGDGTNAGGQLRVYNAAGEDSTFDFYQLAPDGTKLELTRDGSTVLMSWDDMADTCVIGSMDLTVGGSITAQSHIMGGANNTVFGQLSLYGAATGQTQGGYVSLYTAADHDTSIDYYRIQATSDNLILSPTTSATERFGYLGASNQWFFDSAAPVYFDCPVESGSYFVNPFVRSSATGGGTITINGNATGSTVGGKIHIHTADDHDTSIQYYELAASSADFWISPNASTSEQFGYNGTSNRWEMDSAASFYVDCTVTFPRGINFQGGVSNLQVGRYPGTANGEIDVYGYATGNAQGGKIELHAADDYDTTIPSYLVESYQDDLHIYRSNGTRGVDGITLHGASNSVSVNDPIYFENAVTTGSTLDVTAGSFSLSSVAVTATAAELNYLDIVTLGTGAWNKAVVLDGNGDFIWPATTSGIDLATNSAVLKLGSSDWEISGTAVTATGAELNYLDISVLGTGAASKAVVLDGSGNYTAPAGTWNLSGATAVNTPTGGLQIGGVAITSTAAELNKLDGVNATATELDSFYLNMFIEDVSTNVYGAVVVPVACTFEKVESVLYGTIATADDVLTFTTSSGAVTNTLTIAFTGSAAGDIDTMTPGDNQACSAGSVVSFSNTAASTNAISANLTLHFRNA
jgi:hypothetical protein